MTSASKQFDGFLSKYAPEVAGVARRALVKLRRRVPGAVEMVYDNYNALAIGFGPSVKASEAVISIALYPRWVNLFFLQGAGLPDPGKRLSGSGKVVRGLRLEHADDLDDPAVVRLIEAALAGARVKIDPKGRRVMVIKSVSAKQRARRPGARKSTS